jgi:hypothetical protein
MGLPQKIYSLVINTKIINQINQSPLIIYLKNQQKILRKKSIKINKEKVLKHAILWLL